MANLSELIQQNPSLAPRARQDPQEAKAKARQYARAQYLASKALRNLHSNDYADLLAQAKVVVAAEAKGNGEIVGHQGETN